MHPTVEEGIEVLHAQAEDVQQEIDTALDENATWDEVQDARQRVLEINREYRQFLAQLDQDARARVQRTLGPKIDKLNKLAARLP